MRWDYPPWTSTQYFLVSGRLSLLLSLLLSSLLLLLSSLYYCYYYYYHYHDHHYYYYYYYYYWDLYSLFFVKRGIKCHLKKITPPKALIPTQNTNLYFYTKSVQYEPSEKWLNSLPPSPYFWSVTPPGNCFWWGPFWLPSFSSCYSAFYSDSIEKCIYIAKKVAEFSELFDIKFISWSWNQKNHLKTMLSHEINLRKFLKQFVGRRLRLGFHDKLSHKNYLIRIRIILCLKPVSTIFLFCHQIIAF